MSINNDLNELEDLLSSLRSKYDDQVEDVKKEISSLDDEIEVLKAQNELLEENLETLEISHDQLLSRVAQLEFELVEEVMKNKMA